MRHVSLHKPDTMKASCDYYVSINLLKTVAKIKRFIYNTLFNELIVYEKALTVPQCFSTSAWVKYLDVLQIARP